MKKLFCFDIDGTLRTTTDHQIPESTIKALNLLREKGHLLLVSTGRSVDSLKNTHIYDTFAFDGYVCNSGQALLDKNLKLIHKESLSTTVVLKALDASKKHNIPLALKCTPRIINMEPNENVIRSCNYFNNPIPPVGSYTNQEVGAMIAYGPLDYDYQEFKDIEDEEEEKDDEEEDVFDERQEASATECFVHKLLCFITAYIVSLKHHALICLKNYLNFN